ncbi:MAG: outer membrane protein transport protein [Acidobacteriota bacterium]|nr:outer membrane protein transport protein [Acidobacteriota bacterium]
MFVRRFFAIMIPVCMIGPTPLPATDGMSLEGWGAVSTSLGGASMAYDNGMAALMNNPATLIYIKQGESQFVLSLTQLGPEVSTTVHTAGGDYTAGSTSDAFYMPSFGWGKRRGKLAYGVGMFAQGGMGCQYAADSWLGAPWTPDTGFDPLVNRSEVSVGRFIGAVAYEINPRFTIGGSLDFVWAGLDLQMGMSEAQFMDMANPYSQMGGYANGSMVEMFGMMYEPFGGYGVQQLHYAYFDFSNDSDFTGESSGYGYAAKLGFQWQAAPTLSIGGAWHSQTDISDLKTDKASMRMGLAMDTGLMTGGMPTGSYANIEMPLAGEIRVRDFQWPTTYALGLAWHPNVRWMVALDMKRLQWSEVMASFDMTFTADRVPENGAFGGMQMNAGLYQNWEDQTVWSAGAAYAAMRGLELRAGLNLTDNPIPNAYVNPLFPAIIEQHAMLGAGFEWGPGVLDLVVVRSFNEEVTAPGNGSTVPPVTASHDQINWAVQYSWKY